MTFDVSKCKSNLQVALDNAAEAEVCNRGMYPFTAATNVFKLDGTPLEEKPSDEEETTPEEGGEGGSSEGGSSEGGEGEGGSEGGSEGREGEEEQPQVEP